MDFSYLQVDRVFSSTTKQTNEANENNLSKLRAKSSKDVFSIIFLFLLSYFSDNSSECKKKPSAIFN